MKRFLFVTAGLLVGAWAINQLIVRGGLRLPSLDLNQCSREDLLALPGLSESLVDRILENRPYQHRLDLVARMVVPSGIYQSIRDRIEVGACANRRATVAS